MVRASLKELSQLRDSGFGQPSPRHGLKLLYWFAYDYIEIRNGHIVPNFHPENGDFGFHRFEDRVEDDDFLLPNQNHSYYDVGDLHAQGADELPDYVTKYAGHAPDSNKDRVIVRLDAQGNVERVYVTEHSDPKRLDHNKTYRVSQKLLQMIKNMNRDDYLKVVSKPQHTSQTQTVSQSVCERPADNDSGCVIV